MMFCWEWQNWTIYVLLPYGVVENDVKSLYNIYVWKCSYLLGIYWLMCEKIYLRGKGSSGRHGDKKNWLIFPKDIRIVMSKKVEMYFPHKRKNAPEYSWTCRPSARICRKTISWLGLWHARWGYICLRFCVIDFVWVWTFYMEYTMGITKIPLENELIYKIYLTQSN